MVQDYREIAAIALKRRQDAIPLGYLLSENLLANLPRDLTTIRKDSGHFTSADLEILEAPAEVILLKIKEKTWTSLEVAQAFIKASAVANQLTNCLTEILYTEAIARAKFLDEHLATTGKVIGPLHGLPISLKDCFITPPHPSSLGMACYANEATAAEEETVLVSILGKLGAVFYVKTAVPTAMMMMETISNVWGETTGAYHKETSPGGSSGGEGVLLALRASPLGVGTDIGGSIRIPSAFNGLYGLKATYGRFPTWSTKSGIPGQDYIYSNNGPMARSISSIKLYCSAVLSSTMAPWNLDPKCLAIPWKEEVIQPKGRKLRFGIIVDNDGEVTVHPPISRGLQVTKAALEAEGHEVFEWAPIDHPEMVQTLNSSFYTTGGAAIIGLTRPYGEPVYPSMKEYEAHFDKGETGTLGPTRLREMILKRNAFQKAYLDRWQATEKDGKGLMDAIICPASTWTAPRLGQSQKTFCVNFTGVWNVLDYSVCTFPVTFANASKDPPRKDFKPISDLDAAIQAEYDAEFYEGTLVALQCVGRRLEDEKVVEMTEIIAEALKKHVGEFRE